MSENFEINNQVKEELATEEVNVYTEDCGKIQLHCVTDCFPFGTPSISKDW